MKISDIFQYTAQQVLGDRPIPNEATIADSGERAQYITDWILVLLDNAQDKLAVDSNYIKDSDTLAISEYALIDTQNYIDLHESVIQLQDDELPRIEDRTDPAAIKRTYPHRTFHRSWTAFADDGVPTQWYYHVKGQEKRVYFETTPGQDNLFFNIPVIRKPLIRFCPPANETDPNRDIRWATECELPPEYHLVLATWVNLKVMEWRKLDKQLKQDYESQQEIWDAAKIELRLDTYRQELQSSVPVFNNYWV